MPVSRYTLPMSSTSQARILRHFGGIQTLPHLSHISRTINGLPSLISTRYKFQSGFSSACLTIEVPSFLTIAGTMSDTAYGDGGSSRGGILRGSMYLSGSTSRFLAGIYSPPCSSVVTHDRQEPNIFGHYLAVANRDCLQLCLILQVGFSTTLASGP